MFLPASFAGTCTSPLTQPLLQCRICALEIVKSYISTSKWSENESLMHMDCRLLSNWVGREGRVFGWTAGGRAGSLVAARLRPAQHTGRRGRGSRAERDEPFEKVFHHIQSCLVVQEELSLWSICGRLVECRRECDFKGS